MANRYIFRRKYVFNDIVVVDAADQPTAQIAAEAVRRDEALRIQKEPELAKVVLLSTVAVDNS